MVFSSLRYAWNPSFSAVQEEGGAPGGNPMMSNKSSLKDFLASIATVGGDLSNITAPPFVLDQKSVVEIPAFWAENPEMFISPSTSDDPAQRALLILKSFLAGMKSQCYMGHTEAEGVKKPLNAFLGELFLGHWNSEELGDTYLCSEQISHHPPITACRVWNPKCGVIAEGYNRQKVTFSWSHMAVSISSTGFALKTIEKYNEHYLLPLPDFKVKGVLSGAPYPDVSGEYYIPSDNGYMSKIDFVGSGGFFGGGKKHEFSAVLYKEDNGPKKPLYSISGCWHTQFTIRDEQTGKDIETIDVKSEIKNLPPLQVPTLEEMDPWESRRAWHDTREAIAANNFGRVSAAKSFLEQGQRNMRKDEEKSGTQWKPLFFTNDTRYDVVEKLMAKMPDHDFNKVHEGTKGVWKFNPEAYETADRPFHPDLEPDNLKEGEERVYRNGARGSFQASPSTTPRGSIDGGRPSRLSMSDSPRGSIDGGRPRMSISDSPRGSLDGGRPRMSIDQERPLKSLEAKHKARLDEKLGAVETGRRASINGTAVDVGKEPPRKEIKPISRDEPGPQTTQLRSKEEDLGTGVKDLSLKDKIAVEDMLRDTYSSSK